MKNPRFLGIAIFVLTTAFSAWTFGHSQQKKTAVELPAGPNGRYQLTAARVDFSATGGMPAKQTVIRIDTQTGKAWELFEQKGPVSGIETLWIPLNESN